MINITTGTLHNMYVVDTAIKALTTTALGVSGGKYGTVIHMADEASASDLNKAQKVFDNWGNLNPSPSSTSIVVGDPDPTIQVSSPDSDLGYVVLLDGGLYSSGTVSVVTGTATLTLVDPEVGTYDIYFFRLAGNFASGSTTLTVNEV